MLGLDRSQAECGAVLEFSNESDHILALESGPPSTSGLICILYLAGIDKFDRKNFSSFDQNVVQFRVKLSCWSIWSNYAK